MTNHIDFKQPPYELLKHNRDGSTRIEKYMTLSDYLFQNMETYGHRRSVYEPKWANFYAEYFIAPGIDWDDTKALEDAINRKLSSEGWKKRIRLKRNGIGVEIYTIVDLDRYGGEEGWEITEI